MLVEGHLHKDQSCSSFRSALHERVAVLVHASAVEDVIQSRAKGS